MRDRSIPTSTNSMLEMQKHYYIAQLVQVLMDPQMYHTRLPLH